ncbi:MAG TPA: AAA family ATPase [Dehalococcoidia bacterium]|jgi:aminoglycoside phosphotransferase family enzyme/predicted kinase
MPDSGLPPLVRALLKPGAFPQATKRVELIQTHISYVFLTDEYVYKVKKPVDFGFLNYSTLGKRRYYCQREVRLNSLLCEHTYLGVVPIRKHRGAFVLGGREGTIVEYAVWMRRLAEERMLNRLIERGEATSTMVERVAEKLVPFHQATAETSPAIARYGDWAIRYNHRENVKQWAPYVGHTLTAEQDAICRAYGEAFFAREAPVLERRVRELRIRRTHADLRSDAICMENGVCIFDAVEFSRRVSLLDIARDVGFLQMDLEYRGRPDLADAFVRRYDNIADDPDLREVLPFYAYYSACVRGKVEAFLLDIPSVPAKEKKAAAQRSRRYFELACRYAETLQPALLVITCGLSGSGKSTVAREIGTAIGGEVIVSDVVRKRLAGLDPAQRALDEYRAGLYSAEMSARTYETMFKLARELLMYGKSVVLDAAFLRRSDRKTALRLARETGAQFACVLTEADEDEVRRRLGARLAGGRDASDARWEIYVGQKRHFQRPSEVPEDRLLTIDTSRATERQLRQTLVRLRAISPLSVP